ncbi:uncharacterized protein V6R79_015470 [Siganus canaliculatus]
MNGLDPAEIKAESSEPEPEPENVLVLNRRHDDGRRNLTVRKKTRLSPPVIPSHRKRACLVAQVTMVTTCLHLLHAAALT